MEKKKDSGASFGEGDLWSDEVCPNPQPERQTTCPEPSSRAEKIFKLFTDPLRKAVSQNRRRLTKENCNFDLDLTYITDRIIALGYPAEDFEKLYRNTMTDTQRFLNTQHPGAYMVFNLRGKFSYKPEKFENRVISFEMTDHHPPRLEYMAQFCREAHDFLLQNPNHVIAVHCKAGKGRTGVMICAYLVYIGFYPKPRSIMDYYSIIRTVNNKGVTIPSQRRYIYYFHHLRRNMLNYLPLLVELIGIYIECPKDIGTKDLCMRVTLGDAVVFEGAKIKAPGSWANEYTFWKNSKRQGDDSIDFSKNFYEDEDCTRTIISRRAFGWTVPQDGRVFIEGDVRVDIFHDGVVNKEKLGHVWFNTMFVCPSFCQTYYVHGDEEDPYPDELSSISERKLQTRPKTGSASEPPTRPVTDSARSNDRDSDNQPSTSRPGDTGYRKKSKDERKNANWRECYQIVDPPALLSHCPENSLVQLHPDGQIPRDAIKEMLIAAHEKGLVDDDYHERKTRIDDRGVHVPPVIAGENKERPSAGGPCLIRRNPEEHVQCFPVYEIDRAAKKRTLPEECKLFVVTKCIDPSKPADKRLAEYYVQVSDRAQVERNMKRAAKERKTKPCPEEVTTSCLSKYCEPGTADDLRSTDKKLGRYFTKQRDQSPTRYPPADFKCSLYPALSASAEVDYTKEDILEVKKLVEGCHPELKKDESSGSHELKEHCNSDSSSSSNSSSSSSVAINGCE